MSYHSGRKTKIHIKEGFVRILLGFMLPRREHFSREKSRVAVNKRNYALEKEQLRNAFEEGMEGKEPIIFKNPVIVCYRYHYPEGYHACDNDAIDTKYCSDLITSYFLFDDGPHKVSYYIDAVFENTDIPYTEVMIIEKNSSTLVEEIMNS